MRKISSFGIELTQQAVAVLVEALLPDAFWHFYRPMLNPNEYSGPCDTTVRNLGNRNSGGGETASLV